MLLTTYFHEFQRLPIKIITCLHEFQQILTQINTYFHECQHLPTIISTSDIYTYILLSYLVQKVDLIYILIECRAFPRVSVIAERELDFRKRPSQNTGLQLTMFHKPKHNHYLYSKLQYIYIYYHTSFKGLIS